jgi:RNA polymerase sigma-70 factor (ECF subfamily)
MDVAQNQALSAEPKALEGLYRDSGPRLWRAVFAYSADREIADDAVAEAFAQALGRGDAVRDPERWVWRAAFRIAAGQLKERRRREPIQADPVYEMTEPPGDLIRALRTLSPNQRAATVLHFYVGYSTREVAEILGSSSATVRVHLSKGRKRLREALETDDG